MKLRNLGFDTWFEQKRKESDNLDCRIARITAVNRDSYTAINEETEVNAEISGRFRFTIDSECELPAVGDWVLLRCFDSDTFAVIEQVLPRKTVIKRKVAGKRIDYQIIAANIDTAFIVQSCDRDFNLRRLERYLVAVHEGSVEPVILLSKCDLVPQSALDGLVGSIESMQNGCRVLSFSAKSGSGLDGILQILVSGKTFCLLGSSGVGKTTLINKLLGSHEFATREIRKSDGRGRHATTRRQLIFLNNGAMLVDTPGLRELGNIDIDRGVSDVFPEIESLVEGCRFKDCSHVKEEGCSVIEAVKNGCLPRERYESYLKLRKESDYYRMSYLEKRKKDRKLGKFYKSVLKSLKDA